MKQLELRLGNYIEYAGVICEVEEIHKKTITTNGVNAPISSFLSIPLTEEWLIKFYFLKCRGRHGEYFKHKEFEAFRVWYNEDLRSWSVGRKDYDSTDRKYNTYWIRENIESLHLFQNLFFTLTGEELTIKQTESI